MDLLDALMELGTRAVAVADSVEGLIAATRTLGARALAGLGVPPALAPFVVAAALVAGAVVWDRKRGGWER